MSALLNSISEDRRDAAAAAIAHVAGDAVLTEVTPIMGGVSALTYRIEADGRAYALRLDGPNFGIRDTARSYVCLRLAAEAGIAPPLRYADADTRIAVMDFIEPRPFAGYPGGPAALAGDLGRLVGRLQQVADFPVHVDYPVLLEQLLGFIRGSGLFAPGLLDPHAEALQRLSAAYPWNEGGAVASHNDPNPRNIIFDGVRLWLVDWETSFRNDAMVDLAIVIGELAPTPELETALMTGWLGGPPDARHRARLTLMRPLTRLYYAGLLLSISAVHPPETTDADLTAMTGAEFGEALATARLKLGMPELTYALGKMTLANFLDGARGPTAEAAIAELARG